MRETEQVTDRPTSRQRRQGLSVWQQLASGALGVAGGLAVNTLSTDVGYRGAATAATFAAILFSTNWLRQLPSRAPLPRIMSRALLGVAAIAVLTAAANPRWEGIATIVATVLATSAVLIQTELNKAAGLLVGVAVIGGGVALIGLGIGDLRRGDVLFGVAVIGGGVGVIVSGVALLRRRDEEFGVAVIGGGVSLIGVGVALLRHRDVLAGVAVIGGGVGGIGVGAALLSGAGVLACALRWLVSLTRNPDGEALRQEDPARAGLDNPPPAINTPTSEPPGTT